MIKKLSKNKPGFTLVESLVAITVFLVVVTMVSSIYVSFVRQERKLYSFLKTENNIRFALDYMGRDIRMAHDYDFTVQDAFPYGGNSLMFHDYKNQQVTYKLDSQSDSKNKSIQVVRNGYSLPLLDPSISVDYLKFYIGYGAGGAQPTVIITLKATDTKTGTDYSLETAVTPRNLNFSP
ncbi:MAG TPA: prepilin-type N-terminal cleavage/methylation domain-containing protein [Candidatus Paceibacterota bacterium]|nr:prepilin-type N-terminal cleavage/methylation domain-containing protein [Candidatus Paceibacterota bacterium]